MQKFKWDEDFYNRLFAWPRFVIGASLLAVFATALILGSIIFGYSLKLVARTQQYLRAKLRRRIVNAN